MPTLREEVTRPHTAVVAVVAVAVWLLAGPLASAESSCVTEVVTASGSRWCLRGALSRYELWPSFDNQYERDARQLGGMQLHQRMREFGGEDGETLWLVFHVHPGEHGCALNGSTRVWVETDITEWSGARLVSLGFESEYLLLTDSPLELHVYDGPIRLTDGSPYARAKRGTGGFVVMVGVPGLGPHVDHGEYWADLPERWQVSVKEGYDASVHSDLWGHVAAVVDSGGGEGDTVVRP